MDAATVDLRLARQVRAVVNALEFRYPAVKVQPQDKFFCWAVRRSAWLISRFLIKTDGKTGYERLRGRDYKRQVVEPFEVVHYKQDNLVKGKLDSMTMTVGVWLGKSLASDGHTLGRRLASASAGLATGGLRSRDGRSPFWTASRVCLGS